MKFKKKIKISYIISLFFLISFTLVSGFVFLISLKPVKINFLDYFDRESRIFKKLNIKEIGDVFLSFNKVSKNFELLIENVIYENSFFPSILIGFDVTFKNKIFDTSIKIFDSEIEYEVPEKTEKRTDKFSILSNLESNFNLLKKFSDIQVVNTKFKLKINDQNTKNYLIDFNYKNSESNLSIVEQNSFKNFLLMSFYKSNDKNNISFQFDRFNFDFIKYLIDLDSISLENLYLTGSSKITFSEERLVEEMVFNLKLDGDLNYSTFAGSEKIVFNNSPVYGEMNGEIIDIILDFEHINSNLKLVFRLNFNKNQTSQLLLDVDSVNVKELLKIWPDDLNDSVYYWMKENASGFISNLFVSSELSKTNNQISFSNFKGKFNFEQTKIRYMESMPLIEDIRGDAIIKEDQINFTVKSGISNSLAITDAVISLFDLNSDYEKADIKLKIIGTNKNVINYLNRSPINKKSFSKLINIDGDSLIDLNLKFPLLLDLPAEDIEYSSNVLIENAIFKKIFNDFSIDNFNLNIQIDSEKVTYYGNGKLFDSHVEFSGLQSQSNRKFTDKINGKYILKPHVVDYLFPDNDIKLDGETEISFLINEGDNGFSKFEGIGDLSRIKIESNFIGPDLDLKNGKLRFLIRPYDKSLSGFFDIKTNDLNIEINSIFNNEDIIELDIQNFKSPLQDFTFKYFSDSNSFKIKGRKLTLKSLKIFEESELDNNDIQLDVILDNLNIGGMSFLDSKIGLKKSSGVFEEMFVDLSGEDDFHKLNINDYEDGKKFVLESNYIPGLLKILDLDFNINQGSLKIEGVKKNDSKNYNGAIAGKNIVFFDAPFLANFFSIFSLDGFAQKLKDGGIIFNNFNASYKLENEKLKIVDSLLKGSELGIQFDSVVGLNNDYFLMNGSIIPAYTINTLITKFPIVGDIVTAGSPEDGLIGAKFKVEKIDGEYEIFYNPISVFVPNIIKNFLGD